jgi:hypothetical protein
MCWAGAGWTAWADIPARHPRPEILATTGRRPDCRRRTTDRRYGGRVTETRALDEVINEALAVIDKGLGDLLHRELVSTNEVADLLLDVRTLLASPSPGREADDDVVVAS